MLDLSNFLVFSSVVQFPSSGDFHELLEDYCPLAKWCSVRAHMSSSIQYHLCMLLYVDFLERGAGWEVGSLGHRHR